MAISLAVLGLLCLAFIAWLTFDGLRAIYLRAAAEKAKKPLHLIVQERSEVAGSLLRLRLAKPNGTRLPTFKAGQHVLLQAPAGSAGKILQRAYSLAAWQRKPTHYELGIKLESQGSMTPWLWRNLKIGDAIVLSRPQGHFTLPDSSLPLVLIGGGIGITPMRAMLHAGLEAGRDVCLFHAARTEEQLLYREEFEQLASAQPGFRYLPIVSQPDLALWKGLAGRLDASLILANVAPSTEFCLCASDSMMTQLREEMATVGVSPEHIHWEAFGVSATAGQSGIPVSVKYNGTSRQISTDGAPTLLAELEANEISLLSECRAGSCGQCLVSLESGEVEWLTEPEFAVPEGKILPCICNPRSALAISLPASS